MAEGQEGKGGGRQAESREAATQNLKTLAIAAHTGTHTQTHTETDTNYIRSLVFAQIIWVTIWRERRVRRGVAGRRWSRAAVLHIGKSKLGNDVDYNDDDKLTRRIRNPRAKPR